MDVVTHGARTEEDKAQALESGSRLRSSARLGYLNSSSSASLSSSSAAAAAAAAAGTGGTAGNTTNTTTTTTTATTTATTTCRTSSKRKRKRRRRQQRTNNTNDNDNNENNDIDEVDGLQTVLESSSSSTSRTHTNSSILIEDNLLSSPSGNNANTGGSGGGGGGTSATTAGSSSIGRRNDEGTSRHRHNHNNNNNNNNSNYSSNHHRQQQRIEDNNDNTATGGGGGGGSGTRGEVEEEYNNNNRHHEEEEEDEELVGGERSNERNHRNTGNSSSPTTTTTTTTTTLRNGGNNSNTRAAASSTAAAASTAAASAAASSSSSVPSLADITFLNRRTAKRSARRCNNTSGRRNAMTMDLQRLINEVHARPAIWDQKNVNYHNRDVILKMWREIARACEVSTDVAKSKWKHLRDNFRNELKKTYRGKCDGSLSGGNEHDSKWVWFRSLFFLREQMNSRVIGCALNQNCTALRSSPDGTQIEPQIDILEGHEETQFDDLDGDSCQSLLSNDDGLHHVMPPPKMNKIGRKRILMEAMDNDYSEMDRKRYEVLQKRLILNQEEEDDTYHFLMSVKNPLKSLPLDRQMFVRLKIQEIVYNEINSQNHQIRSYDNSQDVKPLKSQNDNGNESTGNNGNNGDVVSDMSNPASLLQNCATEGSSDDAFFG